MYRWEQSHILWQDFRSIKQKLLKIGKISKPVKIEGQHTSKKNKELEAWSCKYRASFSAESTNLKKKREGVGGIGSLGLSDTS